jgi:hypothetical protein
VDVIIKTINLEHARETSFRKMGNTHRTTGTKLHERSGVEALRAMSVEAAFPAAVALALDVAEAVL